MPLRSHFGSRFGIASRLAAAFVAVALLAVAANLITDRGPTIIQLRDAPVATVVVPPSPPVSTLAPPMPAPSSPALGAQAKALKTAVAGYSRAVRQRMDNAAPAQVLEEDQARKNLLAEGRRFQEAATGAGADKASQSLGAALKAYEAAGVGLTEGGDATRRKATLYINTFEQLDSRINATLDRAFKLFGRVLARQSMVDVSRALDHSRPHLQALDNPDGVSKDALEQLAAGELTVLALIRKHEDAIVRTQGPEWFRATVANLALLTETREGIVHLEDQQLVKSQGFDAANRKLVQAIERTVTGGAKQTPKVAEPSVPVSAASDSVVSSAEEVPAVTPADPIVVVNGAPEQDYRVPIAMLTGAVLIVLLWVSIATLLSIVRPVRRLMRATERLAEGERVSIPRGGIKELDALAVAFNVMSDRLSAAQDLSRQYHSELEARVEERTRQLQELAEHDPLTQLPNRRQFFTELSNALSRARTEDVLVGVFFLDLDNFKNVNDSMGHVFGDRVLQALAERLRDISTPFGFAARLGGDEFTVVMDRAATVEEILEAGWLLVQSFRRPLSVDGRDLTISVSAGVSIFPLHETEPEGLLRAADAAMFSAKALGRSQLSVFSEQLTQAAASKFTTEQGLRRALENNEFELFFQPEVNAETGEVTLVEALLRWRQPDGSYLSPGDFLVIAEESGLISEISDWVIRSAVETAARWHRTAWTDVRVAINVSSRQLLATDCVEEIQALVREFHLPARCIEFELTENVLQTGPHTVEVLRRLRAAGFGVALDDFGTGYSSLVSLEQLPLSRVKLDRALIASIDSSPRSLAIARAIIGLCQSLGLEITAEGVERREQLVPFLKHRGMYIQGFLLCPPLPPGELLPARAEIPDRWAEITQSDSHTERRLRALTSVR